MGMENSVNKSLIGDEMKKGRKMTVWRSLGTVSYTHLDVYKRQLQPAIRAIAKIGVNNSVGSPSTVSYTHLDVYKRQVMFSPRVAA